MTVFLWVAFYALVLYLGIRSISAKGPVREILLYACIIGWCAYLSLGKLYGWPQLSVVAPIHAVFLPVGKWLEQLMGG
ncbi:hypothetical protein [Paenibacillus sp. UNC451MF]|uniref:hypothetical protein n=1 Tax=Paenibacillus sp. UNC451MF TaxID=1449063 RepID=UPI0018CC47CE|nr:hypothetical protein [Paenibacillus sp. UNC451MF]